MKMKTRLLASLWLIAATHMTSAAETAPAPARKAAIFVENRVGPGLNDKVPVLEDFLSSRLSEKGFSVISREISADALKTYANLQIAAATATATAGKVETAAGTKGVAVEIGTATAGQIAVTPGTTSLDRAFNDSTSALRLAQNLGADYLIVASISSYGSDLKNNSELKTSVVNYTLRVSYKVLEATAGGSLIGNTVKAMKSVRVAEGSQGENTDLINELLDDAATQVADDAGRKQAAMANAGIPAKLVEISVACGMQDLAQAPVSIPDVRVADDGTLLVSTNRLAVQVLDATVEIDGVAVGSAPGRFKVHPGLSQLRITREGFVPWERMVNCSDGQTFKVALQMSEAGYARWKDSTMFLAGLRTAEKLTDGTVNMMAGFAQTLRQSGFRIDVRNDSKGKSLFDGANLKL